MGLGPLAVQPHPAHSYRAHWADPILTTAVDSGDPRAEQPQAKILCVSALGVTSPPSGGWVCAGYDQHTPGPMTLRVSGRRACSASGQVETAHLTVGRWDPTGTLGHEGCSSGLSGSRCRMDALVGREVNLEGGAST